MKLSSFFAPPFVRFRWLFYVLCVLVFALMPDGLLRTLRLNDAADYDFAWRAMKGAEPLGALHTFLALSLRSFLPLFETSLALGLVLPLLFLAVLFVVAPLTCAGLVPSRRRGLAVLFVVFMPALFGFFSPGVVGAQAYGLLAFSMFLACLLRPVRTRRLQAIGVGSAIFFALVFLWIEPFARAMEKPPVWNEAFFYRQAFLPCLAMVASLALGLTAPRGRRWRFWTLFALQLALAGNVSDSLYALALWQSACVPSLVAFFFLAWDRLALAEGPRRYVGEAVLVAALTFLPVGLVPAALTHAPLVPAGLFAPFQRDLPVCHLRGAGYELAALGGTPRILNHSRIGPELRLRLPFADILAPAPSEVKDPRVQAFFDAETDDLALDIVKQLQVDYVFVCADGVPVKAGSLLSRLIEKRVPDGLVPLGVAFDGQTLLYKVKKDHA